MLLFGKGAPVEEKSASGQEKSRRVMRQLLGGICYLLHFFEEFLAAESRVAGDLVIRDDAQYLAVVARY